MTNRALALRRAVFLLYFFHAILRIENFEEDIMKKLVKRYRVWIVLGVILVVLTLIFGWRVTAPLTSYVLYLVCSTIFVFRLSELIVPLLIKGTSRLIALLIRKIVACYSRREAHTLRFTTFVIVSISAIAALGLSLQIYPELWKEKEILYTFTMVAVIVLSIKIGVIVGDMYTRDKLRPRREKVDLNKPIILYDRERMREQKNSWTKKIMLVVLAINMVMVTLVLVQLFPDIAKAYPITALLIFAVMACLSSVPLTASGIAEVAAEKLWDLMFPPDPHGWITVSKGKNFAPLVLPKA